MNLLNFIRKKPKTDARADACIQEERNDAQTQAVLFEVIDRLRKIENKQKEICLQLDDINEFLRDGRDEARPFIDALIAAADCVEAFYRFAAVGDDRPLLEQAEMMWNKAGEAVLAAGVTIIDNEGAPFDFRLNTAEGAESRGGTPTGTVLRTLKCGYIYQDTVIRRASVVVNR